MVWKSRQTQKVEHGIKKRDHNWARNRKRVTEPVNGQGGCREAIILH